MSTRDRISSSHINHAVELKTKIIEADFLVFNTAIIKNKIFL
jgi:hypothetical protein